MVSLRAASAGRRVPTVKSDVDVMRQQQQAAEIVVGARRLGGYTHRDVRSTSN
jgi:hypothetical protein